MKLSNLMLLFLIGCVGDPGEQVSEATFAARSGSGLYPDLQTVIPQQVSVQKNQNNGVEVIRFSNGIANTGAGPLRLRPENDGVTTFAHQEILDASGAVVDDQVVSTFEFHPSHQHWHIDNVALYEIRVGSLTGPLFGDAIKTTFCLIDWYTLDGNANSKERVYWDCATSYQGISSGWVDQYHQSTDGQEIPITGAAAGFYYLVSTANHLCAFLETDCTNNTAWVKIDLQRDKNGNPKVSVVETSPCDSPGMCGEFAPNR